MGDVELNDASVLSTGSGGSGGSSGDGVIFAYRMRGITRDIAILDSAGDFITPSSGDKIRAIICREGETSKLTVTSDAATTNGSSFTKGATNRLRLDASDLDFDPGTYTLIIDLYDHADGDEWKNVSRQVFHLEDT
jgi:hypothetical protein